MKSSCLFFSSSALSSFLWYVVEIASASPPPPPSSSPSSSSDGDIKSLASTGTQIQSSSVGHISQGVTQTYEAIESWSSVTAEHMVTVPPENRRKAIFRRPRKWKNRCCRCLPYLSAEGGNGSRR
ncbi:hypothetical protein GGR58DRAFT_111344 [Xylaria digitata]|nr:hypothetical protein GGR58DRAFT_111344 [Xylaria digitata]